MRILLSALLVALLPALAQAQTGACPTGTSTAVNPNGWVCVTPDTDYTATTNAPDGTLVPVVVRLDLLLFGPSVTDTATGSPTQTINLGKPALNANAAAWVQVPALTSIPQGQLWKARVVAVGQPDSTGAIQVSARSPESNPFIRPFPPAPAPRAPIRVSVPGS